MGRGFAAGPCRIAAPRSRTPPGPPGRWNRRGAQGGRVVASRELRRCAPRGPRVGSGRSPILIRRPPWVSGHPTSILRPWTLRIRVQAGLTPGRGRPPSGELPAGGGATTDALRVPGPAGGPTRPRPVPRLVAGAYSRQASPPANPRAVRPPWPRPHRCVARCPCVRRFGPVACGLDRRVCSWG